MKQLSLMNGMKYPISDEEAENIKKIINDTKFIELRDGTLINVLSISSISEVETVKYWKGHRLNKDGNSFVRNGIRVYLEKCDFWEIEEVPIFDDEEDAGKGLNEGTAETDKGLNSNSLEEFRIPDNEKGKERYKKLKASYF